MCDRLGMIGIVWVIGILGVIILVCVVGEVCIRGEVFVIVMRGIVGICMKRYFG